MVSILCLVVLSGCVEETNLIYEFGEYRVPGPFEKVVVHDNSLSVVVPLSADFIQLQSDSGHVLQPEVGPSNWSNSDDFFVYIDENGRLYAFDGADRIWSLELFEPGNTRSYSYDSSSDELPETVKSLVRKRERS